MVEGSTYGNYNAQTEATGVVLAVEARSDIDGDGQYSCVTLFQTTFNGSGTAQTAATMPTTSCGAASTNYGIPENQSPTIF
jgi:hypothetical protein